MKHIAEQFNFPFMPKVAGLREGSSWTVPEAAEAKPVNSPAKKPASDGVAGEASVSSAASGNVKQKKKFPPGLTTEEYRQEQDFKKNLEIEKSNESSTYAISNSSAIAPAAQPVAAVPKRAAIHIGTAPGDAALATAPAPSPGTGEAKHHSFGPSRLGYLDECAGFINRPGDSDYSEQGKMLHEIMEAILDNVAKGVCQTALEQADEKTEGLTDDEKACVRFCCRKADVFIKLNPRSIKTELRVNIVDEGGKKFNFGSLDVSYIWETKAIIQDFKFGFIPVKHAQENLQGMNYAVGLFQMFPDVQEIGVQFVQPKLSFVTSGKFYRKDLGVLFKRLAEIVERAKYVQSGPDDAQKWMKPGGYCDYCTAAGGCAILANQRALFAARYGDLPMPVSFKGLTIKNASDMALARYWVTVIESGLEEVKKAAFEMAEANGGEISCTLPNGEVITYEIGERNSARSLGDAIEVAEALKEVCTFEEILGAADLALTRLEPIVKNARVAMAEANGEKITKKAAWDEALSLLEAHGLLSRPDTRIRYLKQKKQKQEPKQIGEQSNG